MSCSLFTAEAANIPALRRRFFLQYVGNFTAAKLELPKSFIPYMKKIADIPATTEIELYEEVKFLPSLMISYMSDEALSADFSANSLDDGDILIIQESLSEVLHEHLALDFASYIKGERSKVCQVSFKPHLQVDSSLQNQILHCVSPQV